MNNYVFERLLENYIYFKIFFLGDVEELEI